MVINVSIENGAARGVAAIARLKKLAPFTCTRKHRWEQSYLAGDTVLAQSKPRWAMRLA